MCLGSLEYGRGLGSQSCGSWVLLQDAKAGFGLQRSLAPEGPKACLRHSKSSQSGGLCQRDAVDPDIDTPAAARRQGAGERAPHLAAGEIMSHGLCKHSRFVA